MSSKFARGNIPANFNPFTETEASSPDGRRLVWGPSENDEPGAEPSGVDWTRYGPDGEIEGQDWAETEAEMNAVVAAFAASED